VNTRTLKTLKLSILDADETLANQRFVTSVQNKNGLSEKQKTLKALD